MSGVIIEVPELGLVSETAEPAKRDIGLTARRVRGEREPSPEIRSKVLFGGPESARMKPRADEDSEISNRRDDADFWSVLMSLTLVPVEPEKLTSAWLRVDLVADRSGPAPIAFAMKPGRREEPVGVGSSRGVEATVSVLKGSGSSSHTYTLHEAEILALGHLRSDPGWQLSPSSGRRLHGDALFTLVAKVPRGNGGRGRVSFGATVEWTESRFLHRRPQEVSWEGPKPEEFSLT